MSIFRKPIFEAVEFEDVPEHEAEELPDLLRMMSANRRLRMADKSVPSYGAYVLRNVPDLEPADVIKRVIATGNDAPLRWTFRGKGERAVHADWQMDLRAADVTAYKATVESTEAIVLVGAATLIGRQIMGPIPMIEQRIAARELFDNSRIETTSPVITHIGRALRTTLSVNDMLLFDHTQIHGFEGTDGRVALTAF